MPESTHLENYACHTSRINRPSLCNRMEALPYYWRIVGLKQALPRFDQVLRPEHALRFKNRDRRIEDMRMNICCRRGMALIAGAWLAAASGGQATTANRLYADDEPAKK